MNRSSTADEPFNLSAPQPADEDAPLWRVAVPTPLRKLYDYLPPVALTAEQCARVTPGVRVKVSFGRQQLIGVVVDCDAQSDFQRSKLKPVLELLDNDSVFSADIERLCHWISRYYQYGLGEVMSNALPVLLRKGRSVSAQVKRWRLTTNGKGLPEGALRGAKKQALLLALLQRGEQSPETLKEQGISAAISRAMVDKGLIEQVLIDEALAVPSAPLPATLRQSALTLNAQQQRALDEVPDTGFAPTLLQGVTGSGKTEVYLQLIHRQLEAGRQALVLVPEIGLTPQTQQRFIDRFDCPVAMLHSAMSDTARLEVWRRARVGQLGIVIGTRSALFTPLPQLGIIIVDEEHDGSFKQLEGVRYNARDAAVVRAKDCAIPIVLGSATPSLESLHNAQQGRYRHLELLERAGGAEPPAVQLVDVRQQNMHEGMSGELLEAMREELQRGRQVLLFLNRRGYSPSLMCHQCGWCADCHNCDAKLTVHLKPRQLHCHHCDSRYAIPAACPNCHSGNLLGEGIGTERSQRALEQLFPAVPVLRVDRDTVSRRGELDELLAEVHSGEPCILVGTQMLAKGHHFPDVTLVAIVDADAGFFSSDFRGSERISQLLVQVAGRAGRAEHRGRVLVQTHHPEHLLMRQLLEQGYHAVAQSLLAERQVLGLPPCGYLVMVRADARHEQLAEQMLARLRDALQGLAGSEVTWVGPMPALMVRRQGRFRAQIMLRSGSRGLLAQLAGAVVGWLEADAEARKMRWSIDVDPQDTL
ncbi:replication restart DNA helicase PriA [Sinobacterium caligoides]|uniref:Replication restart protein PriA n=1 Tax=Sinobacterium caligoides TaxID=933926 RepID=A0A3N2DDS8_9GAMM|nr:primosomal protein N' [Sinobacterium caligoides]ROR97933.1 replication restart DNA helicase PriA [Sinobacterium caligoides]